MGNECSCRRERGASRGVVRAGSTATIWTPPASIKYAATCSTSLPDESTAINGWLQALKSQPGDSVQFAANQCYRTDESVIFADKNGLTFNGNGATFASFSDSQKGRNNEHLEIEDDTNVTVESLNIVGSAPGGYFSNLEAQHAFYVLGGSGVTINEVTTNAVYGDFVSLENDVNRVTPTNITIENSQLGPRAPVTPTPGSRSSRSMTARTSP